MLSKEVLFKASMLILLFAMIFICGCGDELSNMLDEDQTEIDSKRILKEASTIDKNPNINREVPDVYSRPSRILQTTEGVKVFYFAKNKSPADLVTLIKSQMGVTVLNNSVGTNQLVISCVDENEAKDILRYIDKIDVPAVQIKIECMVIENYADFTMDRETRVKVGELFGDDNLIITGPYDSNPSDKITDLWGFFPGASLREAKRGTYGMSVGYSSADVSFLVDMLSSRGYLKVMMNPVITTTANKAGSIVSREEVPIVEIVTGRDTLPYNTTKYTWVEDSLIVTPTIYADGSVGLSTDIKFGSKNTPEGVVQNRIITERSVSLKETRVPVGNSLVIGGFKKSEKFSVIRGFPFLKDLPIIGFMFSSKDFEERAKDITFILTPSIASKGIDFNEMVDKVEEFHKTHESEDESITDALVGIVTDPFSEGSYSDKLEQMAADETIERMKAEVEAAETEREAQEAEDRLIGYEAKLQSSAAAKAEAQKTAKNYSDKLKALEDSKAKLEAAQKSHLEKSTAEVAAAKVEYDKSAAEAQKLKEEFEKTKQQVEKRDSELKASTKQVNKLLEEKTAIEAEKKRLQETKLKVQEEADKLEQEKSEEVAVEQSSDEKVESDEPVAEEQQEVQEPEPAE